MHAGARYVWAVVKTLYRLLHPRFQNLALEYKVDFRPRYGHGRPPHPELDAIVGAGRARYGAFLDAALGYLPDLAAIRRAADEADASQPAWNNGFLPGLDVVVLYAMLAERRPRRYIEIGSGNSTKVAHRARLDHGLDTEIVSIDPQPRAEIDALADVVVRERFEDGGYDVVAALEPGDVLFVDNSHRVLPNSDAMVFYLEVLPRLRPGVIVHVHDIYLPYDYPQFMCDRFYSEQYGLAMYLLAAPKRYRTLMPNYYVSEDAELSAKLAPLWEQHNLEGVERHGGSYWLEIAGG